MMILYFLIDEFVLKQEAQVRVVLLRIISAATIALLNDNIAAIKALIHWKQLYLWTVRFLVLLRAVDGIFHEKPSQKLTTKQMLFGF